MLSCEDTHNKRCCGRAKPEASGCKTLVIEADRAACGDSGEVRIRAYCEKVDGLRWAIFVSYALLL